MLTLVEARNSQGSLLGLPMEDVSGGYSVVDIKGLGPVKATIVSSSFAGVDGTQFQSAQREDRNVVLTLGLQPDYITTSVENLRLRLYNYFMTKMKVDLRFYYSSGIIVNISGRVETCEPDIFSAEPAVNISIICNDSDFIAMNSVTLSGSSTSGTTETLIDYPGSVEVGINFIFNINRTLTDFTIYHRTPEGILVTMDFSASLVAGDILTLNTVTGNKYITLTRSSAVSSLLYAKSPQSGWLELLNGNNYIRVYAVGAAIPYTITYTPRYGGL